MHRFLSLCLVAALLPAAFACSSNQTARDSWKFTTRQYRTYLNTPAQLDMEATGDCENYEIALGDALLNVDAELGKLVRAMENSDRNPDQAWVMRIMGQFPWLSGVALADKEGNPIARYPEGYLKEFDAKPLLEIDPKQRISALRAAVQKSPFGPEVYVANPVYANEDMRGLVIAHFDPRNLVMQHSSNSGSFIIASPAGILWQGGFGANSPVAGENWEEILKSRSCGLIGPSGSRFFWTTRYLGNLPLVYAMPVDNAAATKAKAEAPGSGAVPAPQETNAEAAAPVSEEAGDPGAENVSGRVE